MYYGICEAIHREMDKLEDKYSEEVTLTMSDLEMIDKMAHALKSLATYDAMKEGTKRSRPRYEEYRRY